MLIQFLAGMTTCVGYGFLFHCPLSRISKAAFAGGLGWLAYYESVHGQNLSPIASTLIGTLVLAIVCEILARKEKEAVTIFLIPAILPLVPGAGLYYTLLYCLEGNLESALLKGFTTIGCALSIAIGVIIVSSLVRIFCSIYPTKERMKQWKKERD